MIVVEIKLYGAVTRRVTTLGRMIIANDGQSKDPKKGSYNVWVLRKGSEIRSLEAQMAEATRRGRVENYPRAAYNVWRLIMRALKASFPEEK